MLLRAGLTGEIHHLKEIISLAEVSTKQKYMHLTLIIILEPAGFNNWPVEGFLSYIAAYHNYIGLKKTKAPFTPTKHV